MIWVQEAQRSLQENFRNGKYKRLGVTMKDNGLLSTSGRAQKWMEITYDHQELILLPHDHWFTRLWAEHIHSNYEHMGSGASRKFHLGISSTVAKIRSPFCVNNLLQGTRCKIDNQRVKTQNMGKLLVEQLKPNAAWSNKSLNFFRPFRVKGEVKKRARGKTNRMFFTCLACRAVYLELAPNYSTKRYLLALRRFVSKLYSDPDTQLTAAEKELKSLLEDLYRKTLKKFGAEKDMEWNIMPAHAPCQNRCAEAMVKGVKKAIKGAIGEKVLSYSELQTVFSEAANLVNLQASN